MSSFVQRIQGTLTLDTEVINEIEHDPKATTQALIVVLVVSVLTAIGGGGLLTTRIAEDVGVLQYASIFIWGIAGWFVWAVVTNTLAKLFGGQANIGEMLRVIGFAYAPRAFGILGLIPCIGWAITLASFLYTAIVMVIAIREGADLGTGQAVIVALAGVFAYLIGLGILGAIFGAL